MTGYSSKPLGWRTREKKREKRKVKRIRKRDTEGRESENGRRGGDGEGGEGGRGRGRERREEEREERGRVYATVRPQWVVHNRLHAIAGLRCMDPRVLGGVALLGKLAVTDRAPVGFLSGVHLLSRVVTGGREKEREK